MSAIREAITRLASGALLFGLVPGAVAAPIVFPFSGQFQAGSELTTFTITAGSWFTPPIDGAAGRLAATVTLTDSNGDGATLTGQLPTGNSIEAYYDGSNLFGGVISQVIAPPEGTTVLSEAFPPSGYEPFPYPPTLYSVQMEFTLSAYDAASIDGTLTIVPEPGGALSLALLGAISRRFPR
jgi:hypothetical protein